MVQEPALGPQQAEQAVEVRRELRESDVFEHADRADRVVRTIAYVAVVLQPDFDEVRETGLGDAFGRVLRLLTRERDPDRAHIVVARRVHCEGRPPAADVEQPHAGFERELATDELVLRLLRGFETHGRRRPHSAGVCEARAEQDVVEVVREVVVVRDRSGVSRTRMHPTAEPRFLWRGRKRSQRRRSREPEQRGPLRRVRSQSAESVAEREHGEEIAFDVEIARDVGAPEPELTRSRDQATQRVR